MSLTFDDQLLLTVSEDGCLFTWRVFDKDGRGIKREREVGFAEEVLVTKTDMEEKVRLELMKRAVESPFRYPESGRPWRPLQPGCTRCPALPASSLPAPPCCPPLPPGLLPRHPPVILPCGHLVLCAVLRP